MYCVLEKSSFLSLKSKFVEKLVCFNKSFNNFIYANRPKLEENDCENLEIAPILELNF